MPTDPEEEFLVVDVVSDALEPGWESARLREDCAVEVTLCVQSAVRLPAVVLFAVPLRQQDGRRNPCPSAAGSSKKETKKPYDVDMSVACGSEAEVDQLIRSLFELVLVDPAVPAIPRVEACVQRRRLRLRWQAEHRLSGVEAAYPLAEA